MRRRPCNARRSKRRWLLIVSPSTGAKIRRSRRKKRQARRTGDRNLARSCRDRAGRSCGPYDQHQSDCNQCQKPAHCSLASTLTRIVAREGAPQLHLARTTQCGRPRLRAIRMPSGFEGDGVYFVFVHDGLVTTGSCKARSRSRSRLPMWSDSGDCTHL
jgi:hypothetical protein